jgi:hypothetical protein
MESEAADQSLNGPRLASLVIGSLDPGLKTRLLT